MHTTKSQTFPMLNDDVLSQQINQLLHDFDVTHLFYHPSNANEPAHLLVHTASGADRNRIYLQKWTQSLYTKKGILFHCCDTARLKKSVKRGVPFVSYYFTPSALIYQSSSLASAACFPKQESKFLAKFGVHKKLFRQRYQVQVTEALRQQDTAGEISTFLVYHSLFEFLLQEMEMLYIGRWFCDERMHERIHRLMAYVPELEPLFVKRSATEFYLIHLLDVAKACTDQNDDIYLNLEMVPALHHIAEVLYAVLNNRFKVMQRGFIFSDYRKGVAEVKQECTPKSAFLSLSIDAITSIAQPEEVYLFHTDERDGVAQKGMYQLVLYVLVVGNGISNEMLVQLQQSVADQSEQKCTLVALAHTRIHLQQNVYAWQDFLKIMMTDSYKVYCSRPSHAPLHWEECHSTYYGDLAIYGSKAKRYVAQYQSLCMHGTPENTEGLFTLFAYTFTHLVRFYIYTQLHSYVPNQLTTYSLWKLVVYCNPSLEKVVFLFEQLGGNFYTKIDKHLRFSTSSAKISGAELETMEAILITLQMEFGLMERC